MQSIKKQFIAPVLFVTITIIICLHVPIDLEPYVAWLVCPFVADIC